MADGQGPLPLPLDSSLKGPLEMRLLAGSILLLLLVAPASRSQGPGPMFSGAREEGKGNFVLKRYAVEGESYPFRVFLPPGWSAERTWPVLLFLHGAGERGDDATLHLEVGLGPVLKEDPWTLPAVVVFPQCPPGKWWSDPDMEALALGSLEETIERYRGDRRQIYLMGLSMGGYGTWHLASKHPDLFAALVPICGRLRPPDGVAPAPGSLASRFRGEELYRRTAEAVSHLPAWVFHGDQDDVVPVEESRRIAGALRGLGAEVIYTELPGVGHKAWLDALARPTLYTWLLGHRLPLEDSSPVVLRRSFPMHGAGPGG